MKGIWKAGLAVAALAAVAAVSSLVTIAVCGGGAGPNDAAWVAERRAKLDAVAKGAQKEKTGSATKASRTAVASLATFRDPKGNFTMQVPKGWVVSSGGFDLLHWIHACDPKRPELGVFTLLKTECLLMNKASKSFYWQKRGLGLYAMFADMIVVEKVEDFCSVGDEMLVRVIEIKPDVKIDLIHKGLIPGEK